MFVLRLILVVLAFLVVRRLLRSALAPSRRRSGGPAGGDPRQRDDYRDLTQQDVSDADFEEIP